MTYATILELHAFGTIVSDHHIKQMERDMARHCVELAEPYVPRDTGALIGSAQINGPEISYHTAYARRWHYEPANFQGAPKRGNWWMQRMWNEGGREEVAKRLASAYGVEVR